MSLGNSIQYFGIFLGGLIAGVVKHYYGFSALFYLVLVFGVVWILSLISMKSFQGFDKEELSSWDDELIAKLKNDKNVHDVFIINETLIINRYKV